MINTNGGSRCCLWVILLALLGGGLTVYLRPNWEDSEKKPKDKVSVVLQRCVVFLESGITREEAIQLLNSRNAQEDEVIEMEKIHGDVRIKRLKKEGVMYFSEVEFWYYDKGQEKWISRHVL